jgi:hypothetical protein
LRISEVCSSTTSVPAGPLERFRAMRDVLVEP